MTAGIHNLEDVFELTGSMSVVNLKAFWNTIMTTVMHRMQCY